MKDFLKRLSIFSCAVLVLAVAVEVYVEQMPNISKDKHQWMLSHSRSVKILILGHSHMLYGVRPDMLPSAFSLAQQSQTYRYDDYLLRHYPLDSLKVVILPFDYSSLWEDFESQPGEEFQAMRYRIYMDCDIHPRLGWYGFEIMHIPLVREKLKSIYTEGRNEWDSLGWATNYTLSNRPSPWDDGGERAKNNTYSDTTIVALNRTYLHDMFSFCRKKNVRVLLVNTPTSPLFRNSQDTRQKAVNKKELDKLLTVYPEVQYIDLEADPRFTDRYFYDADHLNTDGATLLTSLLFQVVKDL